MSRSTNAKQPLSEQPARCQRLSESGLKTGFGLRETPGADKVDCVNKTVTSSRFRPR